jgi:hypothetical protein
MRHSAIKFWNVFIISILMITNFTSCSSDEQDDEIGTEFYSFSMRVVDGNGNDLLTESAVESAIKNGLHATYNDYDYPLMDFYSASDYSSQIYDLTNGKPWKYEFSDEDIWQFIPETPMGLKFRGFHSSGNTLFFGCLPYSGTHTLVIHWSDGKTDVLEMTRNVDGKGKVSYIRKLNGTQTADDFIIVRDAL